MHINTMAFTSEDIWQKFDLTSNNSSATSQAVISNHCHPFESILKPAAMLSANSTTAVGGAVNSKTATSISKIMDTDSLVVPDIGDILSDTNLDLDINLDGGIDMDFDYLLDDFLSTKEPLRYDCMWSGDRDPMLMTLNNGASNMKVSFPGNGTVASEETVIPCAANLDITAGVQSMSCFDTPLSSETSDLDETSSDLEGDVYIQRTSCADRLLPYSPDSAASDMSSTNSSTSSSPVHFFSDHSYVATARHNTRETTSPTCVAASNHDRMETTHHDTEIQSSSSIKSKSLSTRTSSTESAPGQQNAFRIPAYPTSKTLYKSSTTSVSNNSLIKLPAAAKRNNSQAKFKFQVKFKSKGVARSSLMLAGGSAATSSSSSRSLLRSTHVRTTATRNMTAKQLLAMTSNKSHQVSKVGTRMNSDNRRLVDMINSPRLNGASPSAAGAARSGTNANMTAASAGSFLASAAAAKDASNSAADSYKKRSSVRDMHNILERQRRIDLRNAFDTLKGHLPDLQKTDKASKIMILTRAAEYCSELTRTEGDLRSDIRQEKLQQQYLVKKLNQLKKK